MCLFLCVIMCIYVQGPRGQKCQELEFYAAVNDRARVLGSKLGCSAGAISSL